MCRGEKTPPEATFMAVSVNTKGVVKSACCLHSEVLGRILSAWQIGRGVCLSKSFEGDAFEVDMKEIHPLIHLSSRPKGSGCELTVERAPTNPPLPTMLMSMERAWQFSRRFRQFPPVVRLGTIHKWMFFYLSANPQNFLY